MKVRKKLPYLSSCPKYTNYTKKKAKKRILFIRGKDQLNIILVIKK